MGRRVVKTEDQKIWYVLSQFWRGQTYNRHGQMSNGHQHKKRQLEESKSYTKELHVLAERGLVAFNNDTQNWDWTQAGSDWCAAFLAGQKSEN